MSDQMKKTKKRPQKIPYHPLNQTVTRCCFHSSWSPRKRRRRMRKKRMKRGDREPSWRECSTAADTEKCMGRARI